MTKQIFSLLLWILSWFFILKLYGQNKEWQNLPESPYEEAIFSLDAGPQPGEWYIAPNSDYLWYTINNGESWERLMDEHAPQIKEVLVSPHNKNRLYVASNAQGLYYSTDHGQTWTNETFTLSGFSEPCNAVEVSPVNPEVVFAGNNRTTNNFDTWEDMPEISKDYLYDYVFLSNGTALAVQNVFGAIQVFRSEDNGQNWSQVAVLTTLSHAPLAVDKDDNLYMGGIIGQETPVVYKSTDRGDSWLPVSLPVNDTNSIEVKDLTYHEATNALYALISDSYGGNSDGFIYQSVDGGQTWDKVITPPMHQGLTQLQVGPDGKLMLTANAFDHSVQVLQDANWELRDHDIISRRLHELDFFDAPPVAVETGGLFALSTGGGIYFSADSGQTEWHRRNNGNFNRRKAVYDISRNPANGNLLMATFGGAYESDDFGAHWSCITSNLLPPEQNMLVSRIFADAHNTYYALLQPLNFTFNFEGLTLVKSVDGGQSWDTLLNESGLLGGIEKIVVDPDGNIFTRIGYQTYRSLDKGATWDTITSNLPTSFVSDFYLDNNGKVFYIYAANYGLEIYYTDDLGNTWMKSGEMPGSPESQIVDPYMAFDQNNDIWVVHNQDSSIFFSPDLGQTWQSRATGFPWVPEVNWIECIAFDGYNTPFAFDVWGQMYIYTTPKVIDPSGTVPFKKHQLSIYPNPALQMLFANLPETEAGKVVVTIADATGRILMQERKALESHRLRLDISQFEPGSYLLTIDGGQNFWYGKWVKSK